MTTLSATDEKRCSSCNAQIVWAVTVNGHPMPIDAQKDLTGNINLERRDGKLCAVVGAVGSGPYISHFATCKNAAKHRKKKASATHERGGA